MSITKHINESNRRDFVLSTYDRINQSSSQQKYTFSKANRFPEIKTGCLMGSYDQPSQLSKRAASIGYGQKKTFEGRNSK